MEVFYFCSMIIKGLLFTSGATARVFQLLAATLGFFLLTSLVIMLLTGGNLEPVGSLRLAQGLQSAGLFLLPPVFLAFLWSKRPFDYLQLNKTPAFPVMLLIVLLMIAVIPLVNFVGDLNSRIEFPAFARDILESIRQMETRATEITEKMLTADHAGQLAVNLLIVAVLPSIGEELYFRGIIQRLLHDRWGGHVAVWVAAILFSAFHFQFFGFVPRLLLGAMMGYLLLWTGSMWAPVLAHFLNNGFAVLYFYFKSRVELPVNPEEAGNLESWWMIVPAAALVLIILTGIRKAGRQTV
jgi:uncharacterized protein